MSKCKETNCWQIAKSRNYCKKHYAVHYRKNDFNAKPKQDSKCLNKCTIEGCNKNIKCKGYCNIHYTRYRKFGDPLKVHNELHGKRHLYEYGVWSNMKQRCYYIKNNHYDRYGGRGIKICDRWIDSFNNFVDDMGRSPFHNAEIDRINNDGNYEPENCRWVSRAVNVQNSTSAKININEVNEVRVLHSLYGYKNKQLSEIYGYSRGLICNITGYRTWVPSKMREQRI